MKIFDHSSGGSRTPTAEEIKRALNDDKATLALVKKYNLSFKDLMELELFQDIDIPETIPEK